jgi:hypothetical protein
MTYITAVGMPLAVGALAGIGTQSTGQFVNNLANPLAGTGNLAKGMYNKGVTALENAGIRTSIPPEARQGLQSNGFLDMFKPKKPLTELEKNIKKEIHPKPFTEDISTKDLQKYVDNEIDDIINTEEGIRRLNNIGIKAEDIENLRPKLTTFDDVSTSYNDLTNSININLNKDISEFGMLSNKKTDVAHELGHWLQRMNYRAGEYSKRYTDAMGKVVVDNLDLAKKKGISYSEADIINKNTVNAKKYKEYNEKVANTNLDRELLKIYKDSPYQRGSFESGHISPKKYFSYKSEMDFAPREPLAFAREFRQNMLNAGVISHKYDNITEEMVKSFMKNNDKIATGKMDRLTSFSGLEHIKPLTDVLNKLPAAVPIGLGAAYLGTQEQITPQYQQGGEYSESELAFLSEIAIKDNQGQYNHPDKITEINSPNITMKGLTKPLLGISKETGETKYMLPNKDYKFGKNTKNVIEIPLFKK